MQIKIDDLKPHPENPRKISLAARNGLGKSMEEFGDLGGFVWNKRTGFLVTGHQRWRSLRERYGDGLEVVEVRSHEDSKKWRNEIHTPDGDRYPLRVVDWDEEKAEAARIVANSPHLMGEFVRESLNAQLRELEESMAPDDFEELRMPKLEMPEPKPILADGPAEMELRPYEHYDYVVIMADDVRDWEWLVDFLGIKKGDTRNANMKTRRVGLLRGIRAKDFIEKIEELRNGVRDRSAEPETG